ncbi:MAG: ATP synthase F1 subunit delta [Terriglobales bacterium]|jgi:F-type H+-transporting ATPase subunit delta
MAASVTNAYARALADVVFELHLDAAKTLQEAQSIMQWVAGSTDLRAVWETPSIPAGQKRAVLDAIAAREGTSRPLRNFLAVLIDHQRIPFLGPIVKQFEKELNRRLGFVEAEITSARDLGAPERGALESQVEKLTEKKVKATYSLDESLLGGAVVKVGSTIYDGSVKGSLERLKKALSN